MSGNFSGVCFNTWSDIFLGFFLGNQQVPTQIDSGISQAVK